MNTPNSVSYRSSYINLLTTLSSGQEQLDYEKNVPIAYVPGELLCQFFDDLYHPKSNDFVNEFSEDELKEIGVFSGFFQIAWDEVEKLDLPPVTKVLALPEWRSMMKRAQFLKTQLTIKTSQPSQ